MDNLTPAAPDQEVVGELMREFEAQAPIRRSRWGNKLIGIYDDHYGNCRCEYSGYFATKASYVCVFGSNGTSYSVGTSQGVHYVPGLVPKGAAHP